MTRALVILLLLALSVFPARANGGPAADADAALLARYVAAGAPIPAWSRSPDTAAALAAEAASHGLSLAAPGDAEASGHPVLLAALRLARALAQGSVLPADVQDDWAIPVPAFDAGAALRRLASLDDPRSWLRSLAPQDPQYQQLRQALATYRDLALRGGWPTIRDGPAPKPGAEDGRVPLLRTRLAIEGDLVADGDGGTIFDAATEQALRRFQRRHGLLADGRLGRATLAALNVGARDRWLEIAANLERWRWLPRAFPAERVMVNAAAAELRLVRNGEAVLRARTIVGTAKHPTPVLSARIVSLLVNPPWDIPTSIAKKEIRPRARRDPSYFEREGIVPHGNGGLRQLPGPKNALGLLKFEMPNPLDVYLHDTPDKRLFDRVPRFFSHGCIRLEHPLELARVLLDGDPSAAIEQAIAGGATRRLPIPSTVPIYVVYFTAVADAAGSTAFYDDLYGRDAPLIAALGIDASPAPGRADRARPSGCAAG